MKLNTLITFFLTLFIVVGLSHISLAYSYSKVSNNDQKSVRGKHTYSKNNAGSTTKVVGKRTYVKHNTRYVYKQICECKYTYSRQYDYGYIRYFNCKWVLAGTIGLSD